MFIKTKNLLMRPAWPEDAFNLTAAFGDPKGGDRMASAPWPYGVDEATAFIDRAAGHRLPDLLIVEPTAERPAVIGGIGLTDHDDGFALEFWIAREHRGRGYACEAAGAMIETARSTMRIERLVASHPVGQWASAHILRKLGFLGTGTVSHRRSPAFGRDVCYANYRLALQPLALAA